MTSPKGKRGRPPRVRKLLEDRKALSKDLIPVFAFAYLLDRNSSRRRGTDRYQEALQATADDFGIGARTLERRYRLHKPVVTQWRKIWKKNRDRLKSPV